ncbi:MAG: tyrosine-type recombinase/integrase [Trueperaceae bacterium]|nr:tyrosine-type recombinase/integrase [Trueperaceae bacterium]
MDSDAGTSAHELALTLLRPDHSACSAREVLAAPGRLAAALTLLRAFGPRLERRRRDTLERALGAGAEPESLAAIARRFGVSRVRAHTLFRSGIDALVQHAASGEVKLSATTDLQVRSEDAVDTAVRWARLTPEQRRIRAVRAANERDPGALWEVTHYVLATRGKKRAGLSDRTRAAYRRGVHDLVAAWPDENLLRPSPDAGAVWLIRLESDGVPRTVRGRDLSGPLAASTVAVRLAAGKALYRALRHVGATDADPFRDLAAPTDPAAPEDKREAYSAAEVGRLLRAAGPVDAAFVQLCATGGLRNAEATHLTWGQVDLERGLLVGVVGKGGRIRDVPAAGALLDALQAIRPESSDPGARVLGFGPARARIRLRDLCGRAGVRYTGREVHGLRHTAGTEVTRRHGIDAAADLLRHANLQTTRRYSKRSRAERRRIADDLAGGYGTNEDFTREE